MSHCALTKMDASVRKELSSLLELLTHSGSTILDPNLTKKLKSICRSSEMYVRAAYEITIAHLSKDHAEIRLSSLQVIKELFSRSHLFRELLIADFQKFSSLVTGTDPHSPLPLPKAVADQLKKSSLLAIREWTDKYGEGYPKLKLGYNFLKMNKKVNFDELVSQTEAARRRQDVRVARQKAVLNQKIREVKQEMKDLTRDIEECMTEISSCFNLLMPRFDLPDIYSSTVPSAPPGGHDPSRAVPVMSEGVECEAVMGGEGEAGRSRMLSSSSFQSLSEDDESSSAVPNQSFSKGAVSSTDPPSSLASIDCQESDSEFLKRHYGIPSSSVATGVKAKKMGGHKGKDSIRLTESQPALFSFQDTESSAVPESEKQLRTVPDSPRWLDSGSDSDSEFEWEDVDPISSSADPDLQEHGIATHGFSIPIQLDAIPVLHEDENNTSILITLRESKQLLLDRYLPTINKWMEWLSKGDGQDSPLREAIDLKEKVQQTLDKFERIKIVYKETPSRRVVEIEQGGSDEKPPEEKIQVTNPEWEIGSHSNVSTFDMELDPTTPQAQIAKLKKKLSSQSSGSSDPSRSKTTLPVKSSLLSKAPVVPFDMDLYHWETPSHELKPLTKAPVGSLHRFWVQEREVDVSSEEQARLRCRTITYPGAFEPVEKTCRAPLPSGKLCPRMDRLKCPFHGPIIPRDENGVPVPGFDSMSAHSRSPIVALDQHLVESIRDAKGIELLEGRKEKKSKGGKAKVKKHPGLTDLKVEQDTPRARLEKKVLSKRAMKRVANSIDTANAKKYKDKFGYNFNYALQK